MKMLLMAMAFMMAAPQTARYAGYDPKRDPAKDLEAAIAEAQRDNKRILLVVGGEWCGWCHTLEQYLKTNDDVRKTWTDNYVSFKVNHSTENRNEPFLKSYPNVPAYPHIFVLEKDGSFLHSQGTGVLETGSTYSKEKMMEFLHRWQPRRERSR
jgi:thioredoxin-related protein